MFTLNRKTSAAFTVRSLFLKRKKASTFILKSKCFAFYRQTKVNTNDVNKLLVKRNVTDGNCVGRFVKREIKCKGSQSMINATTISSHCYESHLIGDQWKEDFKRDVVWNQRWSNWRIFSHSHIKAHRHLACQLSSVWWIAGLKCSVYCWKMANSINILEHLSGCLFLLSKVNFRRERTCPNKWHWIL